jgi:hypothetical protein
MTLLVQYETHFITKIGEETNNLRPSYFVL